MTPLASCRFIAGLALAGCSSVAAADLDREPIRYSTAETDNAVRKLELRLRAKKAELKAVGEGAGFASASGRC